jgi:hypothetical protein
MSNRESSTALINRIVGWVLFFVVLLLLVVCLGCESDPSLREKKGYPLPEELEGCKVYNTYDGNRELFIIHCPHADTTTSRTYSCGKHCTRTDNVSLIQEGEKE